MTTHSNYLETSALLDFGHASLKELLAEQGWRSLSRFEGIGAVYDYVRNTIEFGYNRSDVIAASEVLSDGYGQCNTKAILLMALLRALEVETRLHGFTIHKGLQRGVVPEIVYSMAPDNIVHSWVEIKFEGRWLNLEGFILDDAYLTRLQQFFGDQDQGYCGYGVGTGNLASPSVNWVGEDTYIQNTAINQDFGVFETPDQFYAEHSQEFSRWKELLYRKVLRHWMNWRVRKIRNGRKPRKLPSHPLCESSSNAQT